MKKKRIERFNVYEKMLTPASQALLEAGLRIKLPGKPVHPNASLAYFKCERSKTAESNSYASSSK
jgi:hypothetical protein